ncbi:MAG: hypothetical protein GKR94_24570 [Gammaproteobacteria bacterium]|nr:hypothetical protein [Gammaproteobacteria bacterium]
MSEFWPLNLNLSDTADPLEILGQAKQEWIERSDGLLSLEIQQAESENQNHMLIVHAKHVPSNRTVTLFSIVHRPGSPYPARIEPRDLPNFLKKSYYQRSVISKFGEKEITNEWVCDTPAEFRSQLKRAFNLGNIKADLLSLVATTASTGLDDGESVD